MIYRLTEQGTEQIDAKDVRVGQGQYAAVLPFSALKEGLATWGMQGRQLEEAPMHADARFDTQNGFDSIYLQIPREPGMPAWPQRICIYLRADVLIFAGQEMDLVERMVCDFHTGEGRAASVERLLYTFFDKLTYDDSIVLEQLESRIEELEESLMTDRGHDYVQEIIAFRKKLRVYKRYYEQLLNILETMEENDRGHWDPRMSRWFNMLTGRVDRLYRNTLNLRDYVTQVREAYQAQEDISLNTTMKLFTVLTAIFMPLTLIAGWYGMNFNMPEYNWPWGYPMVIVLSVSVVGLCFYLFKKKKWF